MNAAHWPWPEYHFRRRILLDTWINTAHIWTKTINKLYIYKLMTRVWERLMKWSGIDEEAHNEQGKCAKITEDARKTWNSAFAFCFQWIFEWVSSLQSMQWSRMQSPGSASLFSQANGAPPQRDCRSCMCLWAPTIYSQQCNKRSCSNRFSLETPTVYQRTILCLNTPLCVPCVLGILQYKRVHGWDFNLQSKSWSTCLRDS